jgi:RHS repeat-associated protein
MVRNGAALAFETVADNLYFNGRLIRSGREVAAVDRLGSVRWRRNLDTGAEERFDYWPYGQEKPQATAQEREKFGTYYRDATGLDDADQRYYVSHWGRFLTADPFVTTTALRNPTRGWNRYAYVEGDPVNFWDPAGLFIAVPGRPEPPPPSVPWNLHIFPALQDFVGAPGALLMVPAFWAGEVGGDDSGPVPIDSVTNSLARRLLAKRLEGFEETNCGTLLAREGVAAQALRETARNTNFYDARLSSGYSEWSEDYLVGNRNSTPIRSSFPFGAFAGVIRGGGGVAGKHAVLLYANFYGHVGPQTLDAGRALEWEQGNTLIHELLHILGWSHDRLVKIFREHGLADASDISDWVGRDCRGK